MKFGFAITGNRWRGIQRGAFQGRTAHTRSRPGFPGSERLVCGGGGSGCPQPEAGSNRPQRRDSSPACVPQWGSAPWS
jgi:hypothetical protein